MSTPDSMLLLLILLRLVSVPGLCRNMVPATASDESFGFACWTLSQASYASH